MISRRAFLRTGSVLAAGAAAPQSFFGLATPESPLTEFGYWDVSMAPGLQENQRAETYDILMGISDDALLKPFREMAGKSAPGLDLGGWYSYRSSFNYKTDDAGFAPGHAFGQWISALSRSYAITRSPEIRQRVRGLNQLYAEAISAKYFELSRFPAYSYDKIVIGLIDSHELVDDSEAFSILDRTTALAMAHLPAKAVPRESVWQPGRDVSYTWDESYTLPENLFLAYKRGAGSQYRELAGKYLMDDGYFDPLSRGVNVLEGKHAYSYVNALSSAMQAYLTMGSEKHLLAARNGFDMLAAQSYVTGGWGPDELLRGPESEALFASLSKSHNSFEAPCGSYAHFKLSRYLLRVTRDSRYGDSMERVMYNTVLGAKPLQADGHAFYYADYNSQGSRVYSKHRWPCCSGTLPQVAADYRINTYFRNGRDVYVNLYLPSTLRWKSEGKDFSLVQEGNYPLDDSVRLTLSVSRAEKFALLLRIPSWAEGPSATINGRPLQGPIVNGQFLRIEHKWKTGDEIVLRLPMAFRLEAIDAKHPGTVALLRGPLVLFPIEVSTSILSRQQLLSARSIGPSKWMVEAAGERATFVPFTEVGEKTYSTYVEISS
ncbi:Putative glycosyl hydrolase (DUF1680) [Acidisarcina polymorpha]|uniref:Glycosyl hydrolase (DUF1680) n=2 Tax=Acidisarcina polymorpha TaxID=2211140 RepID=A0A2Z5FU57_9BACT|nr:Putative glycosyl hydrolase (DUF1680) [Acidisarcina polymorpha]